MDPVHRRAALLQIKAHLLASMASKEIAEHLFPCVWELVMNVPRHAPCVPDGLVAVEVESARIRVSSLGPSFDSCAAARRGGASGLDTVRYRLQLCGWSWRWSFGDERNHNDFEQGTRRP